MPRKIRQLQSDLLRAGFVFLKKRGKGDHRRFRHLNRPDIVVTLDGKDGDDAKHYQELQVREAIEKAHEREV